LLVIIINQKIKNKRINYTSASAKLKAQSAKLIRIQNAKIKNQNDNVKCKIIFF